MREQAWSVELLGGSVLLEHLSFLLGLCVAVDVWLFVLGHLQHPRGRGDAGLFLDSAEQGRQRLHDVLDGCDSFAHAAVALAVARVPDGDLGLETLDGLRVGLCQFLVCVLLEHHVGEQALRSAECFGQGFVGFGLRLGGFRLTHLGVVHGIGFLRLPFHVGLNLALLLEQLGVGILLLRVGFGVGGLGFAVEEGIGLLLVGFLRNLGSHEIFGTKALEFSCGLLGLDFLLQFGVAGFSGSSSFDLSHLDSHVQLGLAVGEFGIGLGFVGFPLGLENGRLCLDLGDLLFRMTALGCFSNFTSHTSFGHIDTSLVGRSFVSLAGQESEVFGAGGVLELLDVGIVDAQTKLVEFLLDIFNDLQISVSLIDMLVGITFDLTFCLKTCRSLKISSMVMLETMTRVSPSMIPLTISWTWLR